MKTATFDPYAHLSRRNNELVNARMQLWLTRCVCAGLLIALAVWPLIFREKSAALQTCERPGIMQLDPETIRTKPGAGVWL